MSYRTPKRPRVRVFLCHATQNKEAVKRLYKRLKGDGFDPWLDTEDLIPGQDWRSEISRAVRDARFVVVCLSNHSTCKAGFVQKEIKIALDFADEKPDGFIYVIPARLEECTVPERLNYLHRVDLFNPGGYEKLRKALEPKPLASGIEQLSESGPAIPLEPDICADQSATECLDQQPCESMLNWLYRGLRDPTFGVKVIHNRELRSERFIGLGAIIAILATVLTAGLVGRAIVFIGFGFELGNHTIAGLDLKGHDAHLS